MLATVTFAPLCDGRGRQRGLGMLSASETAIYLHHVANRQRDHLLEDVRVVELWILAIQFRVRHGISLRYLMYGDTIGARWETRK